MGNVGIQAILCVNTLSQTHVEEAATMDHYDGSDMTNSLISSAEVTVCNF